jgi:peptidoglycan hydrolase-like protein with peptidoglycan-binding domain
MRMGKVTSTIVCLVVSASYIASPVAQSQKDKERTEYNAELEKLKRENPAKYDQNKKTLTLALQMFLGEAGYGIGPFNGIIDARTENALRQYQKDNGLPVNGDVLDMDLVDKLNEQQDLREPAMLPPRFLGFADWDGGFVQAQGTWVSLNQKIGIPLQTSQITCIRSQKQCIESRAQLYGNLLSVSTDFQDIERWDKSEIVTKPSDAACVRSITRINRLQKSVTAIDSKISDKGLCKDVPDKDINSELQEGSPVYWNLHQQYIQRRNRIFRFGPDAAKILNSDGDKK